MPRTKSRVPSMGSIIQRRPFDDSRMAAEEYAREIGARYVHVSNEPAGDTEEVTS